MSGETKMAFGEYHGEGLCIDATVYFHVCNMVPVSDVKYVLQTTKVENIQQCFSHLPGLVCVGRHRYNDRSQELQFNLQREGRRVPDWTESLEHGGYFADATDDISFCIPI